VATLDEPKNTVQPAKAKVEKALKVTDNKISVNSRAKMANNLKQAGYR
jgi:hypothetical protein